MTLLSFMRRQCVVPMVAVALAAGCATDIPSFANRFTTPGERAFPRGYLQLLADGRLDSAFSLLAPELRTDTTRRLMSQVAALLRDAQLDSMRLIGVNTASFGTGSHDVNLTYEMPTTAKVGFSNGWFLLFGGAATSAGPAAPWIVAFALPIGAGIAYLKVRRWRQGTHPTPGTGTGEVAA